MTEQEVESKCLQVACLLNNNVLCFSLFLRHWQERGHHQLLQSISFSFRLSNRSLWRPRTVSWLTLNEAWFSGRDRHTSRHSLPLKSVYHFVPFLTTTAESPTASVLLTSKIFSPKCYLSTAKSRESHHFIFIWVRDQQTSTRTSKVETFQRDLRIFFSFFNRLWLPSTSLCVSFATFLLISKSDSQETCQEWWSLSFWRDFNGKSQLPDKKNSHTIDDVEGSFHTKRFLDWLSPLLWCKNHSLGDQEERDSG